MLRALIFPCRPRPLFPRISAIYRAIALVVFAALASPPLAWSAGIVVTETEDELNSDGDCSLREAIVAANTDTNVDACGAGSGADSIRLPSGLFNVRLDGSGEDQSLVGDLDIRSSITINGSAAGTTTIQNFPINQTNRLFHVRCSDAQPADINVTFRRLDLVFGYPAPPDGNGGGILIDDCGSGPTFESNVTIDDVYFVTNLASAVYDNTGGFVTIKNSRFESNHNSFGHGGPLGPAVTILGGGLTTIEDSDFWINEGFLANNSTAIYVGSPTNIRRSTFWENRSNAGGPQAAIECRNTTMNLFNVTISNNQGYGGRAGINGAESCTLSISSSTIVGNDVGGAVADGGLVTIENTILAKNGPLPSQDLVGNYNTGGHNLVGNRDAASGPTDFTDMFGTTGNEIDPQLSPLGELAALTGTRRLHMPGVGSPVLDTGSTLLSVDARGAPRPDGSAPDRGAAERQDRPWGFNLDFGFGAGEPSAPFSAAGGIGGFWNSIGVGLTPSLTDGYGNATPVSVNVVTDLAADLAANPESTDEAKLLGDWIWECNAVSPDLNQWSVEFTGLPAGDYEIIPYGPERGDMETGSMNVGGAGMSTLLGDLTTLVEDESFDFLPGGTTLSGSSTFTVTGVTVPGNRCAGIAGLQIVPEPRIASGLLVGVLGIMAVAGTSRKHGRSRPHP